MTLPEIKSMVEKIDFEANNDDREQAHIDEDALYEKFVRHVADAGDPALKKMATEVLKTKYINFRRWYG
jgi:hypothetical protein